MGAHALSAALMADDDMELLLEDGGELASEDSGEFAETSDFLEDFLTGERIKNTPKERVRQRIIRALSIEYAISLEDIAFDFPVPVASGSGRARTKRVDIAIFEHAGPHELARLTRAVVCRPEPVPRVSAHDQRASRAFERQSRPRSERHQPYTDWRIF